MTNILKLILHCPLKTLPNDTIVDKNVQAFPKQIQNDLKGHHEQKELFEFMHNFVD